MAAANRGKLPRGFPGLWGRRRRPRHSREATNIAGAMRFLMQSAKRSTVCFVVSDFFDDGFETTMRTANRRHDVIAVQVGDRREDDEEARLQLPALPRHE